MKSPTGAPTIFATVTLPSGVTVKAEIQSIAPQEDKDDKEQEDDKKRGPEEVADTPPAAEPAATPVLYPLGAYGLQQPLAEPSTAIFRGATIWTCDETGVITGDLLIRDGKIVEVGPSLPVPADCQIIDARGKHITPGLIDCHSHMGTDGGVNESGQAVTAEVRIGDFIDNSDINIYRQLAGGLTTSNILHGSANPIGGQNQVIKLRWGDTMEGLRMKQAPAGNQVRTRRKRQTQPIALSQHADGSRTNHSRSIAGRPRVRRCDGDVGEQEFGPRYHPGSTCNWKRWPKSSVASGGFIVTVIGKTKSSRRWMCWKSSVFKSARCNTFWKATKSPIAWPGTARWAQPFPIGGPISSKSSTRSLTTAP